MYKTVVRVDVRCPTHTRFHPERDGLGAVKAGCIHCTALVEIYALFQRAQRMARHPALAKQAK